MSFSRFNLFLAALFGSCIVLTMSAFAGSDDSAIVAATKKYLAANSYSAEMKVTIEKVEGDYARVVVSPKDHQTDDALVFLKRQQGVWKGLTIGTGFDPEDLAKMHIPSGLRP